MAKQIEKEDDDTPKALITCRVEPDSYYVEGSRQLPCSQCNNMCWISPTSEEILADGIPIVCTECILQQDVSEMRGEAADKDLFPKTGFDFESWNPKVDSWSEYHGREMSRFEVHLGEQIPEDRTAIFPELSKEQNNELVELTLPKYLKAMRLRFHLALVEANFLQILANPEARQAVKQWMEEYTNEC